MTISNRPVAVIAAVVLALVAASGLPRLSGVHNAAIITGPYASLLAGSNDLGPSRAGDAQLTVTLAGADSVRTRCSDGRKVAEACGAVASR